MHNERLLKILNTFQVILIHSDLYMWISYFINFLPNEFLNFFSITESSLTLLQNSASRSLPSSLISGTLSVSKLPLLLKISSNSSSSSSNSSSNGMVQELTMEADLRDPAEDEDEEVVEIVEIGDIVEVRPLLRLLKPLSLLLWLW